MSFPLKNTFLQGAVNTDSAHEYVPSDVLVLAENIDLFNQGENYVIQPSIGNTKTTVSQSAKQYIYLGYTTWKHLIYLFYARDDDTNNFIIEYDSLSGAEDTILQGTLGFPSITDPDFTRYVLSADVVDGVFLCWTWGVRQSDGELDGYGEPKRIHIEDARADSSGYENISGNLDRPDKLSVTSGYDAAITNNLLKFGSYILYKRYTTKYNEETVLSFPSECVNVSEGFGSTALDNFISVGGFIVNDYVTSVDILMSNDSTNTFQIVKTIDTTVSKTVPQFTVTNSYEYPVLSANPSEIINNNFPHTATEQEIVDNAIVFGDVLMDYEFVDDNGDAIDKNTPFSYTATGLSHGNSNHYPATADTAGDLSVVTDFTVGTLYHFVINSWKETFFGSGIYTRFIYEFDYTHTSEVVVEFQADLSYLFNVANPIFTIAAGVPVANNNFTVVDVDAGSGSGATLAIEEIAVNNSRGLNTDFQYKGGIVFMDDKGRNLGVSNVTDVFHTGTEWTFNIKPNISASGITAPFWATKYMFVRDKVNTNLSYSIVGAAVSSSEKTGYEYYRVETPYYTNYFADNRGKVITVYSKSLQKDIEVTVLTLENRADEVPPIAETTAEYIFIHDDLAILDGSLILFQPNKEVESTSEVYFETSDIFNITNGVFEGDTTDNLKSYDTEVGFYDKTFATATGEKPYIIMKTDTESLLDINHLGRGAYSVIQATAIKGNTTIIHSQRYTPESNYNGLSDFSYVYGNIVDLERKYGSVEKLFFDDTNLRIGQKRKWSIMPINKNLLSTATGTGALQSSTSFFDKRSLVTMSGDFGITDKQSFASYGNWRFFVDQNRGVVGRQAADGITVINGLRDDEITAICNSHDPDDRITGGFDVEKKEYVVAFHGSDEVLRFSTTSGQSVGNYILPEIPIDFIKVNTDFFTAIRDVDKSLYKENQSTSLSYYGTPIVSKFSFIVNSDPNIIKDFISTSINGRLYTDDELGGGETFDISVDIETEDNLTTLAKTDFLQREGIWYADYQKDEKTSGQGILGVGTVASITDTTTLELKSNGNNLRVGNTIYQDTNLVGTIESYDGTTVNFTAAMSFTPSADDYIYTKLETKIEGNSIKGNTAKVTVEMSRDISLFFKDDIKIFSVTNNINLSSNVD